MGAVIVLDHCVWKLALLASMAECCDSFAILVFLHYQSLNQPFTTGPSPFTKRSTFLITIHDVELLIDSSVAPRRHYSGNRVKADPKLPGRFV
jgi:hypothetical protein